MSVKTLRAVARWDDMGEHHSALRLDDTVIVSVGRVRAHRKYYPRCYRIDVLGNAFVVDSQPTITAAKRAAERGAAVVLTDILTSLAHDLIALARREGGR